MKLNEALYKLTNYIAGLLGLKHQPKEISKNTTEEDKKRRWWLLLFFFLGLCLLITVTLVFRNNAYQNSSSKSIASKQSTTGIYSYLENFVLSVKEDSAGHFKYGFVGKDGAVRIPYEYDEAMHFDEYGYARVKIGEDLYLIDTLNRRFSLAESVKLLNGNVLALSLKEQYLDSFPMVILKNTQLEILYLRGNRFEKTIKGLEILANLRVLDLGYNKMTVLPEGLAGLKNLRILDLRNNFLTAFDSALLELPALEILNLSGNQIGEIPLEIKKLKNLKTLDISNNELQKIDKSLAELPNLRYLNVYQNNIDSISKELTKKTELVIHAGGHKMKRQSFNNSYKGNKENENEEFISSSKQKNQQNSDTEKNIGNNKKEENDKNNIAKGSDNFRYQILKIAGDNQSASAYEPLDKPIQVAVFNPYSQPLAGVTVSFEVAGGGSVSAKEVVTDKDGLAQVNWVVGSDGEQVLTVIAKEDSTGKKASIPQTFNAISHYIVDERDGTAYSIVTIGTQTWMAENLRFKAKGSRENPANPNSRYGRLYSWEALMGDKIANSQGQIQGLCPKGWHVPNNEEWDILKAEKTLAAMLKSSYDWISKDQSKEFLLNRSGFNSLPAGKFSRISNSFADLGAKAYFWSATEITVMYAWHYQLYLHVSNIDVFENNEDLDKDNGFSCRCVKD